MKVQKFKKNPNVVMTPMTNQVMTGLKQRVLYNLIQTEYDNLVKKKTRVQTLSFFLLDPLY